MIASTTHILGDGLDLLLVRDGPAVAQREGAVAADVDDGDGGGDEVDGDGDEHDVAQGPQREEERVGKGQEVVGACGGDVDLGDPLGAELELAHGRLAAVGPLEGQPLACGGSRVGLGQLMAEGKVRSVD